MFFFFLTYKTCLIVLDISKSFGLHQDFFPPQDFLWFKTDYFADLLVYFWHLWPHLLVYFFLLFKAVQVKLVEWFIRTRTRKNWHDNAFQVTEIKKVQKLWRQKNKCFGNELSKRSRRNEAYIKTATGGWAVSPRVSKDSCCHDNTLRHDDERGYKTVQDRKWKLWKQSRSLSCCCPETTASGCCAPVQPNKMSH